MAVCSDALDCVAAACAAAGAIVCTGCDRQQSTGSCSFAADRLARLCAASGAAPACSPTLGAVETPQPPTPLLDISGLHTHEDYFPVIEVTLTTLQRDTLNRPGRPGGGGQHTNDFTAPVSIHETSDVGDGPDVATTTLQAVVGRHGKGTLSCARKSLEINLPEKVRIAGKKMKKMILISMCQDDSYAKMLSTMHIAQKLKMCVLRCVGTDYTVVSKISTVVSVVVGGRAFFTGSSCDGRSMARWRAAAYTS